MTTPQATPTAPGKRGPLTYIAAGCALLAVCVMCAAALGGGYYFAQRGPAASQPAVEYVLDASTRMALPSDTGSGTRLSVAQSVLDEIVRPSDPALTAGLRVFGTGKQTDACADTDLLVPLARASQAKISASLLAVNTGSRPDAALAAAVVAALRDLAGTKGPHTLVVVTGGTDSCSEQASELIVAEAKKNGIDYQLFVVGFLVPDDEGTALSGLVDNLGTGHYINAHSTDELAAILTAIQQYVNDQKTTTVAAVLASAAAVLAEPTAILASQTPPASAETQTATPTRKPTLAPSNTPSPAPVLAPRVTSFLARFDPVRKSTFYSVTVSLETSLVTGTMPALNYAWSNSNPCGQFTGTNSPVAEWRHPDVPGSCPNEPVHPGVITVVVSNAFGAVRCEYDGGSAPGNIVQCQDVPQ